MITFSEFKIDRKSERAILVLLKYDEEKEPKKIWFPLAKVEIENEFFKINKEFWNEKLEEIKSEELENNRLVNIPIQRYEEFEKTIKIVFKMKLKDREIVVWAWLPISLISNINEIENEEVKFNVTVPNWCWQNSLKSAIKKQLEFYNQENIIYNSDDFILVNSVE